MAKTVELKTVGYEGEDLETFVAKLQAAKVERVIDVRFRPQSRKRGFSKTPLSERLKQAGIEYVHYKELGTPNPIREAYKKTGDVAELRRKYSAHLNDQHKAMAMVYGLAATKRSALLCYEAEHQLCHREVLAERLASDFHGDYDLRITHIPPAGAAKPSPRVGED
jgi:uncharacterized protein (DUF488 family)